VITLDPKTYQAQVDQAEARVRIQQIAIERQRLLIHNLKDRFSRQKALFKSKLVDQDSYETLENQLALARVDLRSLQESLLQSRAALDQSKELLGKTRITSPIDGIVIQNDIKVGETVIAGTTNIPGSTLMVIADPSATLTEVQVDEADIATVRVGQSADIYSAAYPDSPLAGTVESIATVARRAPGQQSLSFLVKILLEPQDELIIRPGMSVRADIYTHSAEESLAVPIQAIQYDDEAGLKSDNKEESKKSAGDKDQSEQTYVFIVANGKAVRKTVEIGLSSDSEQEIISGVKQGQQVIVGPYRVLTNMRDGNEVEIREKTDAEKKAAKTAAKNKLKTSSDEDSVSVSIDD